MNKLFVFCSVLMAFTAASALALPIDKNDKTADMEKTTLESDKQLIQIELTVPRTDAILINTDFSHNENINFISTMVTVCSEWTFIDISSTRLSFNFSDDSAICTKDIESGLHLDCNDVEPAWLKQYVASAGLR